VPWRWRSLPGWGRCSVPSSDPANVQRRGRLGAFSVPLISSVGASLTVDRSAS
jgi:hypothetical protein